MRHNRVFKRLIGALTLVLLTVMASGCGERLIVLDPKGPVGEQQRDLIYISTLLCLVIIVPVLIMTFVIAWRYRERKNSKAKYAPEWEHNNKLEMTWWGIPILIIAILGIITVRYTYALEPSKPLASQGEKEAMTIQVTSLDWKWLFYYPEEGIATVNYIRFPEDVPVKFLLTSDAPMNSFWIPQLGGQIYTMSGMAMTLHLQADEPGKYMGSGANFSGKDFAKMQFTAEATSKAEFDQWVADIKKKDPALTEEGYKQLAMPGVSDVVSFSSFPKGLFDQTVTKYGASHNHGNEPAGSGNSKEGSSR